MRKRNHTYQTAADIVARLALASTLVLPTVGSQEAYADEVKLLEPKESASTQNTPVINTINSSMIIKSHNVNQVAYGPMACGDCDSNIRVNINENTIINNIDIRSIGIEPQSSHPKAPAKQKETINEKLQQETSPQELKNNASKELKQ